MPGKVYFITGGNRGIGFELVKQLAEENADNVIIASTRDASRSKELKALPESKKNVKIVTLDVSSEESINKLDAQLQKVAADGIDVFISNAGIAGVAAYKPISEVPREVWVTHHFTNVLGPILVTQKVLPYLEKKDTKQIIWISSLAGAVGDLFFPMSASAYGQSKAALNYTLRTLAYELGPKGFTAIAVHPGVVSTEMGKIALPLVADSNPDLYAEAVKGSIEPEESARLQIKTYGKLTKEDNGKFYNYDGSVLTW